MMITTTGKTRSFTKLVGHSVVLQCAEILRTSDTEVFRAI